MCECLNQGRSFLHSVAFCCMIHVQHIKRCAAMWAIWLLIFAHFLILNHLHYLGQGSLSRNNFACGLMRLFFLSTSCPSWKSSSNSNSRGGGGSLIYLHIMCLTSTTSWTWWGCRANAGVSACRFFAQKLGRDPSDEDCFFDLLSKFQSSRMDDQRCRLDEPQNGDNGEGAANSIPSLNEMIGWLRTASTDLISYWSAISYTEEQIPFFSPLPDPAITTSPQTEELFDLIASSQSRRLDDQRVNVGSLPGLRITQNNLGHLVGEGDHQEPSDDFFNMLIKCQVRPPASWDSNLVPLIIWFEGA